MIVRIAYADLTDAPLVSALERLDVDSADRDAAAALAAAAFSLRDGVAGAVARLVLASRGPFARLSRAGIAPTDPRVARAALELEALGALAHAPHQAALARHGMEGALDGGVAAPGHETPSGARELLQRMRAAAGWGALAADIAHFHRANGTGDLATHRVLRFGDGVLTGVPHPDPVGCDDLVGGEARREPLRASLTAFTAGGGANDALLYGPPGTGKSVTVRALAAEFGDAGLRLIRLERAEASDIRGVFAEVAGEGPRCLVLLDDLIFDDHERTDRALRAALEGDVAERPANVLVWATTNRLGLVRDTLEARQQDTDQSFGRIEKAALATRFGQRIAFPALVREEYLSVALGILAAMGGCDDDDAREAAMRFARRGHGMTHRTARQFAVDRMAAS